MTSFRIWCQSGVEFVCMDADSRALENTSAGTVLQLGAGVTDGIGADDGPDLGRQAAQEDRGRVSDLLEDTDMALIVAGMGGGTGTGASPVFAEAAREQGILAVAVVTMPFPFEHERRMAIAEEGVAGLGEHVDSLIIIPGGKLWSPLGERLSAGQAFAVANDVLLGVVRGITDLVTRPGMIDVDFEDVRAIMSEKGRTAVGLGRGTGADRARLAIEAAVRYSLLGDVDLSEAPGVLVSITAGPDLGMDEFAVIGDVISSLMSKDARVIVGTAFDESAGDEIRVSVVATGIGEAMPFGA